MITRVKPGSDQDKSNYIEVDLTKAEMDNIVKGRYPSRNVIIEGKVYIVSVGLEN